MFGKCSECLQPCDSPGRPARQASSARHVRQPGHHWHWQPERSQARPEPPKDSPKPPGRGRPSTSKEKASVDKLLLHTRPGNPGTRRLTARLSAHMGPIRGHRQIVTEGSYLCPPATDGAHLWTPSVDRSFSLDPNTSRPTPLSPSPPPHPRRRTGLSKHSAQRPVLRLRPVSPSKPVGPLAAVSGGPPCPTSQRMSSIQHLAAQGQHYDVPRDCNRWACGKLLRDNGQGGRGGPLRAVKHEFPNVREDSR